jgi:hypothetical protein
MFAHLKRAERLWRPHGYHSYPVKFIPQLVHRINETYSVPGDLIGDLERRSNSHPAEARACFGPEAASGGTWSARSAPAHTWLTRAQERIMQ